MVQNMTPFGYWRDDINWSQYETAPGVFSLNAAKQVWIDACAAHNIKVIGILNQYYHPSFYTDRQAWSDDTSGSSPAARFAAWFCAQEGSKIAVLEVANEPSPTAKATLSVYHPGAASVRALDLLSGEEWGPTWTQSGPNVLIQTEVENAGIAYTVSNTGPAPSPTPTPAPTVVQQGSASYGSTSISVTASKPEQQGDTKTVTLTHSVNVTVTNLGDGNGNSYAQSSSMTNGSVITEVWVAKGIKYCAWNDNTYANFSRWSNLSMTVVETVH